MHLMVDRLRIGQVPVDVVSFAQALDAVEALVAAKQGGFVFTPNIDHVVVADAQPAFAQAYQRAALCLADGMPLVWASRLLGRPLPGRVAGSDLIVPLLERAGRRGWRVFFFGAGPGVAQKAAEVVEARFGTQVVGVASPQVRLEDAAQVDAIAREVRAAAPDLVLFALGAPKQELLIAALGERLRPAVSLGIGAGLDFLAGTVKRAPPFFRQHGLEWLYRLAREPRRLWRRYLVNDPRFALILWRTLRARGPT
ncbi:MAG: WecB/TagA/CpsF family glycosyltransferase [Myxococcales bacterium]|nr:WecB/TagA/CpsF family glycosyltransferase [Myxococcales bacterium]